MRRILGIAALVVIGLLVVLLATAGLMNLLRDPTPAHVYAYGRGDPGLDASSPAFPRTAALLTGTLLQGGTSVDVLSNGNETFPPLWRDLRRARTSISAQLYYVMPGALLDSLATILAERSRSGVRVHLLYDAVGADIPDSTLASLARAGVEYAVFRPVKWYSLHKAQNRSHARIVVVDGVVGYTGGFGIDDRWQGDGRTAEHWRDTNVRFAGPAVPQLQASFVSAWAEATGRLLVGPLYFPPPAALPPDSTAPAELEPRLTGVLHSVPSPGNTAGQQLFALSVAAARQRLFITNAYFVPSRVVVQMLLAARRRGVDVRLLLPGERTDVPLTRWGARSHYRELLEGGIRIYEYDPSMLHAKTFSVDGVWTSVGSMNLDARSFVHNDEINLVAWDRRAGRALDSLFLQDLAHAREIRLDRFLHRPWRQRVAEAVARQLTKVL